jgi:hypothetical protein
MILLAIGAALMPDVAMAQAAGSPDIQSIFTPSATDISVQLLNSLFPSLTNPLGNTGAPPATQGSMDWSAIAKVIAMFNAGLLIIGGAMLTYNIVSGVAQTAHEGAVLGKNCSSLWAPIRVVIGIGALAPIPGSGYCAAQIIVGKAALIGVAPPTLSFGSTRQWASITSRANDGTRTRSTVRSCARRKVKRRAIERPRTDNSERKICPFSCEDEVRARLGTA